MSLQLNWNFFFYPQLQTTTTNLTYSIYNILIYFISQPLFIFILFYFYFFSSLFILWMDFLYSILFCFCFVSVCELFMKYLFDLEINFLSFYSSFHNFLQLGKFGKENKPRYTCIEFFLFRSRKTIHSRFWHCSSRVFQIYDLYIYIKFNPIQTNWKYNSKKLFLLVLIFSLFSLDPNHHLIMANNWKKLERERETKTTTK